MRGNEDSNVVGEWDVFHLGLLVQDRDPGLHVRGLNVGDESPLETVSEAVLKSRDFLGKSVRGNDDLFVGFVEGVEGMKKLLLSSFLAGQELDVIENEHINITEPGLEFIHSVPAQGGDQLVHEGLGGQVSNF